MTEFVKIIQALQGIPGEPYGNLETQNFDKKRNREWNDFEYQFIIKKTSPAFELPKSSLRMP
jgi:NAD(P)H-quinone oxidoreductase subunit H